MTLTEVVMFTCLEDDFLLVQHSVYHQSVEQYFIFKINLFSLNWPTIDTMQHLRTKPVLRLNIQPGGTRI